MNRGMAGGPASPLLVAPPGPILVPDPRAQLSPLSLRWAHQPHRFPYPLTPRGFSFAFFPLDSPTTDPAVRPGVAQHPQLLRPGLHP